MLMHELLMHASANRHNFYLRDQKFSDIIPNTIIIMNKNYNKYAKNLTNLASVSSDAKQKKHVAFF